VVMSVSFGNTLKLFVLSIQKNVECEQQNSFLCFAACFFFSECVPPCNLFLSLSLLFHVRRKYLCCTFFSNFSPKNSVIVARELVVFFFSTKKIFA